MHLVRAAMEEELEYFNSYVWEAMDRKAAEKLEGHKLVRMRWVICNKGDEAEYDVRARLVACEVNTFKTDEYFASTPPLEAKRLLFSEFARTVFHPEHKAKDVVISFVDVKKAYFNGRPRRNVHLVFPKELGIPAHLVAHLNRCVYGTRDAGAIWEDCYADALQEFGFTRGVANPCCFHHAGRNLMVVVHGDDFTAVGAKADILWYESSLATKFDIKMRGHLGFSDGCVREMRILNRIVRLMDDGLRYEADPRHAEMMIRAMDLAEANAVSTPGVTVPSDQANLDAQLIHESDAENNIKDDEDDVIMAVNQTTVTFSIAEPEVLSVVPYSEVYGIHPKLIVATREGWKWYHAMRTPSQESRIGSAERDNPRESAIEE